MNKPLLIVVTGRAGSGKTTLSRRLADRMHLPLLSRDALKEGYVHTAGQPHNELPANTNQIASSTFFRAIDLLVNDGVSLVVEAAFQHKVWAPSLAKLKDVARLRIVICTLAPELARARFLKRGLADPLREHYHGDRVLALTREGAEPPLETYVPPALEAPTLHIDTADGYQPTVDELIAFILRGE